MNALTIPIVWFILPFIISNYWLYTLSSEFFAIFSESIFIKKAFNLSYVKALTASISANIASFMLGFLIL
jgi:uncharacterized membrane protein